MKEIKTKNPEKVIKGKNSRAAGNRFEKKVREDLEKKGWIVDKWTNNVSAVFEQNIGEYARKLEPAKPKFVFNPGLKRRVMIGNSSGFPDFIAIKNDFFDIDADSVPTFKEELEEIFENIIFEKVERSVIVGVESKMDGKLDKEEKLKCEWLLKNNIFSKILIAQKGNKRGEIIYKEFIRDSPKVRTGPS